MNDEPVERRNICLHTGEDSSDYWGRFKKNNQFDAAIAIYLGNLDSKRAFMTLQAIPVSTCLGRSIFDSYSEQNYSTFGTP